MLQNLCAAGSTLMVVFSLSVHTILYGTPFRSLNSFQPALLTLIDQAPIVSNACDLVVYVPQLSYQELLEQFRREALLWRQYLEETGGACLVSFDSMFLAAAYFILAYITIQMALGLIEVVWGSAFILEFCLEAYLAEFFGSTLTAAELEYLLTLNYMSTTASNLGASNHRGSSAKGNAPKSNSNNARYCPYVNGICTSALPKKKSSQNVAAGKQSERRQETSNQNSLGSQVPAAPGLNNNSAPKCPYVNGICTTPLPKKKTSAPSQQSLSLPESKPQNSNETQPEASRMYSCYEKAKEKICHGASNSREWFHQLKENYWQKQDIEESPSENQSTEQKKEPGLRAKAHRAKARFSRGKMALKAYFGHPAGEEDEVEE